MESRGHQRAQPAGERVPAYDWSPGSRPLPAAPGAARPARSSCLRLQGKRCAHSTSRRSCGPVRPRLKQWRPSLRRSQSPFEPASRPQRRSAADAPVARRSIHWRVLRRTPLSPGPESAARPPPSSPDWLRRGRGGEQRPDQNGDTHAEPAAPVRDRSGDAKNLRGRPRASRSRPAAQRDCTSIESCTRQRLRSLQAPVWPQAGPRER